MLDQCGGPLTKEEDGRIRAELDADREALELGWGEARHDAAGDRGELEEAECLDDDSGAAGGIYPRSIEAHLGGEGQRLAYCRGADVDVLLFREGCDTPELDLGEGAPVDADVAGDRTDGLSTREHIEKSRLA